GAEARRAALDGAFRARAAHVAGRVPLLIDDVATTGATLRAAAAALRLAGARRVEALVLARTP
ncbi:MAG: phosphoribosyltransferase family protein, partial [Candidatus Polarisedimenticolia bacterium]